jgi:membrane protease YdiL (CAAX protease family)
MEATQLIMKYLICYSGFFILSWLAKSNDGNKLLDEKGSVRNSGTLIGLQIGGILWLGLVPFFIFKYDLMEIVFGNGRSDILSLIIFLVLIVAVVFVAARQSKKAINELPNRESAINILSTSFVARYVIARFIFLCIYEIFFRGYLLTDSIDQLGIALAITINIILYTLVHIFSGKKEIIGCIPFGLALCAVSILFKAVWPAIILHLALSFTFEISSLNRISKSLKPVV